MAQKFINNVNDLSGKDWLHNAINFYSFKSKNIFEIEKKFVDFCYKKRSSGKKFLHNSAYLIDDYDFTFQYLKNFEDLKNIFEIILNSSYNSYHIILLDCEVINNLLVSKTITQYAHDSGIEYRGKTIIWCEDELQYCVALIFLNRTKINGTRPDFIKFQVRSSLCGSFVVQSKSKMDRIGLMHPAPFSYLDIETICNKENIINKTILDPFIGVGSTILGTFKNNYTIGIELNKNYVDLVEQRFAILKPEGLSPLQYSIICGDSRKEVKKLNKSIDVVITSPPYFNILKNKTKGVRHDNSQKRQGVDYYSESKKDIGNIDTYDNYIVVMKEIYKDIFSKMKSKGKFYLIISDFTVNKIEKDVHSDMILAMCDAGFTYCSTSFILQNQKAIYPFGYPFKIVLNHIFQYIMVFEK